MNYQAPGNLLTDHNSFCSCGLPFPALPDGRGASEAVFIHRAAKLLTQPLSDRAKVSSLAARAETAAPRQGVSNRLKFNAFAMQPFSPRIVSNAAAVGGEWP